MENRQKSVEDCKNEFYKTQIKFNERLKGLLPSIDELIEKNEDEIKEVFSFFNFDLNEFFNSADIWKSGRREKPSNYKSLSLVQQLIIQFNIEHPGFTQMPDSKLEMPYLFLSRKFNEELVLISKLEVLYAAQELDSNVDQICNVDYLVKKKLQNKDIKY